MSNFHRRSSSVCREPSLSSYRPSFSSRTETRYSRAMSESRDPSSRSSSRPPRPSMSTSYHNDYSSRVTPLSYSSRYASTGNLSSGLRSSFSYRPTEPSSSYRSSESYRNPSNYRASSTFTPRFESRLPPRDFSSSSLSKYRPESSTSYSRPIYSGSRSSSSYSSTRPRPEFRSKTPTVSESTIKHGRFDRDYKSMTRFEKTPVSEDKSEDEVENTFQQLFDRYVKSGEMEETAIKRKFVSHSEAEETNSEEEESLRERSLIESRRKDASMTPKGPSPVLVTPMASPVAKKKVTNEPKKPKPQTVEEFRQKHSDVEMKPAVIEARVVQPTAMANLLKMNNFTAKISDALLKKKNEPENKTTEVSAISEKPVSSVVPASGRQPSATTPKGGFFKAFCPKSETASTKISPISTEPVVTPAPPSADLVSSLSTSSAPKTLAVPMVSGSGKLVERATTEEPKTESHRLIAGKAKSSSPRPKSTLTIDTKSAEEASTSVTILMPKTTEVETEASKMAESEKKKTRNRNRTLENMLKEVADKKSQEDLSTRPPPLLLVTQPSVPSTPKLPQATKEGWASGSGSLYGSDEDVDDEEGWTEGEDERDYDSDLEFCISETFRIPTKTRIDLYPPSIRGSPFVSDYESDCSAPFLSDQKWEDSRGRVNNLLFAVPPPTFTCSVSYDGQESWESDSVHSCEDGDDEDLEWRPGSSSLAAYRSPGPFESDEDLDGAHFCDSVQVGFTLKLVDKAARKGSDESDDSEYYDDEDEEYSEEEYWDEDEEFDEEEEEYTDEDYEEEEGEEFMLSAEEKSPSPLLFTANIDEEQLDYDETEETIFETSFEMAPPVEAVQPTVNSTADKYREITYTQNLEMNNTEETADTMGQEERAKAIAKKIKKDGKTEMANKLLTPQMVAPIEESINLVEAKEVPAEATETLSPSVVDSETSTSAVTVIPTYARPLTAKIEEESTSRFSTVKPSTDFAKKAVIQPTKLEKVQMKEPAIVEKAPQKLPVSTEKPQNEITTNLINKESAKPFEDKSAVRKSTLNMKEEDAKKKVAADERVARQKARRFGTVEALADIFKPKDEPIVYKRSSRLEPKTDEPKTRKKYEIVKPVINDQFDQQMKEIRAQMKAGSSQLQTEIKNLSKGITSATEEAKKRELDDKHRQILDRASGVFNKAEEEKQKWRERKIGKTTENVKTNKNATEIKKEEEPKKEPKRTIRRLKKDKENEIKTEKSEPIPQSDAKDKGPLPEIGSILRKDRTPVVNPADTLRKPVTPKQEIIVDDNNVEILTAATKVAVRKRNILADKDTPKAVGPSAELEAKIAEKLQTATTSQPPKSEGATATKIRNNLSAAPNSAFNQAQSNLNTVKRYTTRRKTQEIVNESCQPKRRRRIVPRHGKFVGSIRDIDVLLGWGINQTFEAMEIYFNQPLLRRVNDVRPKQKRPTPTKIWISDLTDIDKIYKVSEMRDIRASVEVR